MTPVQESCGCGATHSGDGVSAIFFRRAHEGCIAEGALPLGAEDAIREEALEVCAARIAATERHLVPGMMPAHPRIYFSDDDVRLSDVLTAIQNLRERGVA